MAKTSSPGGVRGILVWLMGAGAERDLIKPSFSSGDQEYGRWGLNLEAPPQIHHWEAQGHGAEFPSHLEERQARWTGLSVPRDAQVQPLLTDHPEQL